MKNKKGFTLIELLAVIIILAVIALIATPIVLNVVDNARKSANKDSAYGLLDSAKLYYMEGLLDESKSLSGNLIDKINVSGRKPDSGELYINSKGETALAVLYDKVCFIKNYSDTDLTESDDIENCTIASKISEKKLGDIVKLTIGTDTTSEWYVLEDNSTTGTVRLLKATSIDNEKYAFDEVGNRTPENSSLCEQTIENFTLQGFGGCTFAIYSSYKDETTFQSGPTGGTKTGTVGVDSTTKQKVDSYGSSLSLENNLKDIRLLTVEEYENIKENGWTHEFDYFLMRTNDTVLEGDYFDEPVATTNESFNFQQEFSSSSKLYIRPVITVSRDIIK